MIFRNRTKVLGHTVIGAALCAFLFQPGCATSRDARKKPEQAKEEEPAQDEGLDEANSVGAENGDQEAVPKKLSLLPTTDQLIEAKLSALRKKQEEQEKALAEAEQKLQQEVDIEKRTFDTNAYLSLKIKNTAPPKEYLLRGTEIFVDGKRIARGGKRNAGLPRSPEVFFGPVQPGCHDILVKAIYVRQTNDLISRFKMDRVEHLSRSLAFVAKTGYRVEVEVEGFEAQNTFIKWSRGPALRFNRSVRPNFLPGAPMVSMDDVLKQGRVHIDYLTEDTTQHKLIEKSVSIDGLPILVKEKHDEEKDKSIVFSAPLAEGRHKLSVVLLFGEQKRVGGGPMYNFRLTFDRDFAVISGQSTIINLSGMPHDGFRSSAEDTRYARATSRILSQEHQEMFSEMTCKEQLEAERLKLQEQIRKDAKVKVNKDEKKPETEVPPEDKQIPSVKPEEQEEKNPTAPSPEAENISSHVKALGG